VLGDFPEKFFILVSSGLNMGTGEIMCKKNMKKIIAAAQKAGKL